MAKLYDANGREFTTSELASALASSRKRVTRRGVSVANEPAAPVYDSVREAQLREIQRLKAENAALTVREPVAVAVARGVPVQQIPPKPEGPVSGATLRVDKGVAYLAIPLLGAGTPSRAGKATILAKSNGKFAVIGETADEQITLNLLVLRFPRRGGYQAD